MQSGWNLTESTIPFSHQSEAEVIRLVNLALSPAKKHTSTYKYAFFKAILDNLFNVDLQNYFLSYDTIALRYTEIYWNLVLKFRLKQMPTSERAQMTAVERKLFAFCDKYGFDYSERSDLNAYRTALQRFGQITCFYCHKPLPLGIGTATPVDHCIPWSFVKDDKIWNFVLACPACNSAKSNILPVESYIEEIKQRNLRLQNIDLKLVREDFRSYSHSKLQEMHKSAVFNGFLFGWKPKTMAKIVKYQIHEDSGYLKVADSGV